ncbi:MAG: transporter family-2 protein [Paracoccaceae bacterium]|jgi:transporter family-2 protein|tara:strand:- start:85 stop:522 length:438 start_codon:yes stop_codon:yes gene_type:complete
MLFYALTMLAAGIGIPFLAAFNSALGRHIGAPATAAVVLLCVALSAAVVVCLLTGVQGVGKLATAPRHLFLGGLFVAFYILSVTFIAPHFGVGNAIVVVVFGQLISAAVIDHFGLVGAPIAPLSLMRAAGLSFMALGVLITVSAR